MGKYNLVGTSCSTLGEGKLAQIIVRMEHNQTLFAYKAIGYLRGQLEARVKTQKDLHIIDILKDVKNVTLHGITQTDIAQQVKWHIMQKI